MATKTKKVDGPNIDELRKKLVGRERRYVALDLAAIELRTTGADPKIGMYIPFGKRSVEMYGFTETIAPGAFARTIKNGRGAKRNGDVVALWNHDPNWVLGRQSNDTLALVETNQGLDGEVTLDGQDAMHQHFARRVERRDVQGSSFGFETVRDEWQYNDDGTCERTLLEVKLYDVSPVTYPAYPDSDSEARSLVDLATVRSGIDLGELASVLRSVEHGKVPQDKAAEVRTWLQRLEGVLPPPAVPPVDWGSRLALRERSLRA